MGMEYVTCTNYDPSAGCVVSTVYQYVTLCNVYKKVLVIKI